MLCPFGTKSVTEYKTPSRRAMSTLRYGSFPMNEVKLMALKLMANGWAKPFICISDKGDYATRSREIALKNTILVTPAVVTVYHCQRLIYKII